MLTDPRALAAALARRLASAGTQARADAVIAEMRRKVEIAHAHPVARGVLRVERSRRAIVSLTVDWYGVPRTVAGHHVGIVGAMVAA